MRQRLWASPISPYTYIHRTACNHLFCIPCAESHFSKDPHCPADRWCVRSAVCLFESSLLYDRVVTVRAVKPG